MDIDALVGLERVEQIRRRIEKETGRQPIPVWHENRGWDYFERMCKEYEYVAIGGLVHNPKIKQLEKLMPRFVQEAHTNNAMIHALGYTSLDNARNMGFDSVDSTSWTAGARFAQMYGISGSSIKGSTKKKDGKKLNGKKANEHNMEIWTKYARLIDSHSDY